MRVAVVGRLDRFTDSFPSFFCAMGSEGSLVLVAASETMGLIEERRTGPEMMFMMMVMVTEGGRRCMGRKDPAGGLMFNPTSCATTAKTRLGQSSSRRGLDLSGMQIPRSGATLKLCGINIVVSTTFPILTATTSPRDPEHASHSRSRVTFGFKYHAENGSVGGDFLGSEEDSAARGVRMCV